jgi:hypothetical protein
VTLDLLVLALALELPLQALNKSNHVGLALSEEVDLGLEDLLVGVLFASLEEVEEGKDEVPVEVREEGLEEGSRGGGGGGRGGGRTSAAGGSGRDHGGGWRDLCSLLRVQSVGGESLEMGDGGEEKGKGKGDRWREWSESRKGGESLVD